MSEGDGAPARRLLVGFDGSDAARIALCHAAALAHTGHGCLTVALVHGQPPCCAWPLVAMAETPQEQERRELEALRAAVAGLAQDISVVSVVCRGAAGPALLREARRTGAEAIVIGARRGAWSRLTGGVAHYLHKHAEMPVIVCGQRSEEPVPSTPARSLRVRAA